MLRKVIEELLYALRKMAAWLAERASEVWSAVRDCVLEVVYLFDSWVTLLDNQLEWMGEALLQQSVALCSAATIDSTAVKRSSERGGGCGGEGEGESEQQGSGRVVVEIKTISSSSTPIAITDSPEKRREGFANSGKVSFVAICR